MSTLRSVKLGLLIILGTVTRLGNFESFYAINYVTKLPKLFDNFLGYCKKLLWLGLLFGQVMETSGNLRLIYTMTKKWHFRVSLCHFATKEYFTFS